MKKRKKRGILVGAVVIFGVFGACFGKKIKHLYISLNSFKDENLAYTFQHTPEIQPTKKISKGENTFQFLLSCQMDFPLKMYIILLKNLWKTRKLLQCWL